MAHAAEPVGDCEILRRHPRLTFRLGRYSYETRRDGKRSLYTVSDGQQSISEPLLWALGTGKVGQTYVLKRNGAYYETRVSFYSETQGLGVTLGYPHSEPTSLENALGSRLPPDIARLCINCHTTGAVTASRLEPGRSSPGVTCEACHGPGERHVAAMKAGRLQKSLILDLATLAPADSIDFCGACHRTYWHVFLRRIRGIENVRFQPYRLQNSRCWTAQRKITCLSCHDPHQPLEEQAAKYDSKCLACHPSQPGAAPTSDHVQRACPVSNRDCVTCHMPKYKLPGSEFGFRDHWIRVVRPGEPYPG